LLQFVFFHFYFLKKSDKLQLTQMEKYSSILEEMSSSIAAGSTWRQSLRRASEDTKDLSHIRLVFFSHFLLADHGLMSEKIEEHVQKILKELGCEDLTVVNRCHDFVKFMTILNSAGADLVHAVQCHLRLEQRITILTRRLLGATRQLRYQAFALKIMLILGVAATLLLSEERRQFFLFESAGQIAMLVIALCVYFADTCVCKMLTLCEARFLGKAKYENSTLGLLNSLWKSATIFLCLESCPFEPKFKSELASSVLMNGPFEGLFHGVSVDPKMHRSVRNGADRLYAVFHESRRTGSSTFSALSMLQQDLWFCMEEQSEALVAAVAPQLILPIALFLLPALVILCVAPLLWEVAHFLN
jgi:hypothetical protein